MQVHIFVVIILLVFALVIIGHEVHRRYRLEQDLCEMREEHSACYAALVKKQHDITGAMLDLRSATKCINMQRQNAITRDQQLAQSESTVQVMAAEIKSL